MSGDPRYMSPSMRSNIARSQASRRVPMDTARTLNPYTPQTGHPGGNGPIEMLVNGGFSGSADGWTLGPSGSYDGNNELKGNGGTLTVICAQEVEISVIGQVYRIGFNLVSVSAGSISVNYGGETTPPQSALGKHTIDITASNEAKLYDVVCGSSGFVGIIDSLTLRKL